MDNNKHTSPFLFFLCFLFCLFTAYAVTQPAAGLSPMKDSGFTEVISAEKDETGTDVLTEEAITEETSEETSSAAETTAEDATAAEETVSEEASEAVPPEETSAEAYVSEPETAESTEAPVSQAAETAADGNYTVSPEAANGSWSKSGGEWFFVTEDGNYHGWFYDTDGHVYYLNPENGVMTTGWLDLNGNRYYFNTDGVMQTGDVEVDGQIYHFNNDGILEGAGTSAEAQPEIVITAVPAKTP